jgi:phosphatidate cytidylyltransferase
VRDLRRRTITALVYAAIVLLAVAAPPVVFAVVLAAVGIVAAAELYELRRAGSPAAIEALVLAVGIGALSFLRFAQQPPYALLAAILAVWAADVVAYVVGSTVGRRKIVPRISPGKTWEGTLAGFLAATAVALAVLSQTGLDAWSAVAAAAIGPIAFAGDLLESWLKRRAGVKDSGTLLPGHGGMLDRIDSLVAAGPLVAAAMVLAARMG